MCRRKSFFKLNTTCFTRKPDGKIFIEHSKTNKRKFVFSQRTPHLWNKLPSSTKFAQSTNSFKNLLDNDDKFMELLYDFD